MKCIILGMVVFIGLVWSKVVEDMELESSESYIVKDKVMRLRKRNKKFIEFMDEIIKYPSLSDQQMRLFNKIQNYTQFIYEHHLENNFDFKDLIDHIQLMNTRLYKKQKTNRVRQQMNKFDFGQGMGLDQQQQSINTTLKVQNITNRKDKEEGQQKEQSIQEEQQQQQSIQQQQQQQQQSIQQQQQQQQQNISMNETQYDKQKYDNIKWNSIRVQKINKIEQKMNITDIQDLKERLKREIMNTISEHEQKEKTEQINKQSYNKLENEMKEMKIYKNEQLNGLQMKIESLVNYQKNEKQKMIEQDLQNRIENQKQHLDQQLQKDMSEYQEIEEEHQNNMNFGLMKQILNNTGIMNDIQQQEIRNNNNSLLVQKILNDLIKSEQLKNEVITDKINELVKQVDGFKQVLNINRKLKQQIGQMKIEQTIILENLQRQSSMQNQQQNALKTMKQKINEYQNQLRNKNYKIVQLNQSLYERSSQFINESLVTEKSKYIINKLCLNILKDFRNNDTNQLVTDYLQSLKFIKGVFVQQKTMNVDQIQTVQEYIQDSQDYYDEQMILGRVDNGSLQVLVKMFNDLIEFLNLVPFDDQFKFLQKSLKKQFSDNLQPFLRVDGLKQQQEIIQNMVLNDDQVGVKEMILDLELDVDRTNKQMNRIQKDLVSFLKEQQMELHH